MFLGRDLSIYWAQGVKEALLVAWCLDADGQAPVALGPGNKSSEAAGASTWVTWSPVVFVFLPRSDRRCPGCDPGRLGGLPLLSINPLLVSSPGQHQKQSSPMRRPQRSWRISLRLGMLPPSMPPGRCRWVFQPLPGPLPCSGCLLFKRTERPSSLQSTRCQFVTVSG